MFTAPGTIFTIKRDVLVKAGGFHPSLENSQMYGIVPFGVTGFDESAVLYWRSHEGQLNLSLTAKGHVGLKDLRSLLKGWDIHGRWKDSFGESKASFVVQALLRRQLEIAASWFVHNIYAMRPAAAWRIFREASGSWIFWKSVPYFIWAKRGILKVGLKEAFRVKG
jgi:hypothetical protein